jgi:hypothetical protein
MGIDLEIVLDCTAAAARRALRQLSPGHSDESARCDVTSLGARAALVRTHFRFPIGEMSDAWREIAPYVRSFAKVTGHRDPRGVLAVPETHEIRARSYERFVELTGNQGYWVRPTGPPRRGADNPVAERRRSTPRTRPPEGPLPPDTKLACFVLPRAGLSTDGGHAAMAAKAALEDGTLLLVVRELFSDPEALLRFVVHYPALAKLATDARGLLVIPASAFDSASRLRSYDELVAKYADAKPRRFWLKVGDLEALREVLDRSRDDTYLAAWAPRRGAVRVRHTRSNRGRVPR